METNEVTPLGSDRSVQADVRYVAATHKDLSEMVAAGRFREDLYHRLAGNVIRLPPLRERVEDIVAVGMAFVRRYVPADKHSVSFSAIERWLEASARGGYPWPGNVRELHNSLRDLMLGLPPRSAGVPSHRASLHQGVPRDVATGSASLQRCADWYFDHVLACAGGNLSEAARILGVDRSALYRRGKGGVRRR